MCGFHGPWGCETVWQLSSCLLDNAALVRTDFLPPHLSSYKIDLLTFIGKVVQAMH